MEAYKSYPDYFTTQSLYLKDHNNQGHYIHIPFPTVRSRSDLAYYIKSNSLIEKWKGEYVKIGNFQSDIEKKRKELEEIIFAFKTLKNLKDNFQEAGEFAEKLFPIQEKISSQLPAFFLSKKRYIYIKKIIKYFLFLLNDCCYFDKFFVPLGIKRKEL